MKVLPENATLDYYKVVSRLRKHLNAVMVECNDLRTLQRKGGLNELGEKALIRAEESRDTLAMVIDELNARYYELQPDNK